MYLTLRFSVVLRFSTSFFFVCFTGCQCLLLRSLCGSSCLSAIGHNRKRAYPHATAAMYSVMVSALYSHVTSLTSLYTSGFQAGNATPSKGRFTSFFFFFFLVQTPVTFFFLYFCTFLFRVFVFAVFGTANLFCQSRKRAGLFSMRASLRLRVL